MRHTYTTKYRFFNLKFKFNFAFYISFAKSGTSICGPSVSPGMYSPVVLRALGIGASRLVAPTPPGDAAWLCTVLTPTAGHGSVTPVVTGTDPGPQACGPGLSLFPGYYERNS